MATQNRFLLLFQPPKQSDMVLDKILYFMLDMKEKRKFSKEAKLKIINEASTNGVVATCTKYGIYPASYYSWKKKFEEMGVDGFKHGMTKGHQKEIRRLEKENDLLKKLLAEKELEGHLKDELIKKKYAWARKKN